MINLAHLRTKPFDFNPILLLDGSDTPQGAYVGATNGHCALKRPKTPAFLTPKSHFLHITRLTLCRKMSIYHIYIYVYMTYMPFYRGFLLFTSFNQDTL